jgi:hypothetical protein
VRNGTGQLQQSSRLGGRRRRSWAIILSLDSTNELLSTGPFVSFFSLSPFLSISAELANRPVE